MQESPNRRFWLDKVEAALSRLVTSHSLPKSDVQALYSLYEDLVQRESFHSWNSVREDCDTWLRLNNPKSELFKPQHAFWDGLVSLISTDWYQRVWTHQEGLLASEAMLLLPRASVRYRPVEQLVWIAAGVRRSTEPPSELDMRNTRVLMDALLGLRLNNRDAGSALGIHIVMTRRRRASSQRDLVYGLLGLMKEPVRREINVDYTLPLATVFVQATYAAVMEHPRMLPFMWESFSHTMTTNSELPSWCPDFENRSYSAPFGIELPKVSDSVTEKYKDFAKATYADPVPTLSFSAWRLDTVLNSVGRIDRSVAANLSSTPTNQENSDADLVATTFRAVVELTSWLHAFDNTFPWEVSEDSIAKLQRILKFVVLIDQHLPGQREAFYGKILHLCRLTTVSSIETIEQISETLARL